MTATPGAVGGGPACGLGQSPWCGHSRQPELRFPTVTGRLAHCSSGGHGPAARRSHAPGGLGGDRLRGHPRGGGCFLKQPGAGAAPRVPLSASGDLAGPLLTEPGPALSGANTFFWGAAEEGESSGETLDSVVVSKLCSQSPEVPRRGGAARGGGGHAGRRGLAAGAPSPSASHPGLPRRTPWGRGLRLRMQEPSVEDGAARRKQRRRRAVRLRPCAVGGAPSPRRRRPGSGRERGRPSVTSGGSPTGPALLLGRVLTVRSGRGSARLLHAEGMRSPQGPGRGRLPPPPAR